MLRSFLNKVILIFFSIMMLETTSAFAGGDTVGNGGVIWACRSGIGNRNFHRGILTDLYEAHEQHKWTVIGDEGGDPLVGYEKRKAWLQQELPDLFNALKPRFEYVEQHQVFVNGELLPTKDFDPVVKPSPETCLEGEWQPVNMANFREDDQQVLINFKFWQSPLIATLDKVALLFHEAVYYWMRTYYGSTDSYKSRKITGVLFSTLPTHKMKEEITKVLGSYPDRPDGKVMCVMKHSQRNQIYVAYDMTTSAASLEVRMRCQNDPEPKWCGRASLDCEGLNSKLSHQCITENTSSHKLFVGKGRNLLEAQFNAHMSCYIGSQSQGVSVHNCSEFSFMECESLESSVSLNSSNVLLRTAIN